MTLIDRRRFISGAAGLVSAAAVSGTIPGITMGTASAVAPIRLPGVARLSFVHLHTGEKLALTFRKEGVYDQGALAEVNNILRDWRTGEAVDMDLGLLELLVRLRHKLDTKGPFEIISAYRAPATNAALAANSGGVAKKSYHMRGMAVDVRVPGIRAENVYPVARGLKAGGVGLYRKNDFVHVDTGPVRTW
ncbi:DUF882 domain-containing protein [Pacificispira sp.]|uniref:DUF882 domain-containing protein n=1 Tax=Pacificispira sp. TaxID=2888761 RepID=UPI003BAC5E6D